MKSFLRSSALWRTALCALMAMWLIVAGALTTANAEPTRAGGTIGSTATTGSTPSLSLSIDSPIAANSSWQGLALGKNLWPLQVELTSSNPEILSVPPSVSVTWGPDGDVWGTFTMQSGISFTDTTVVITGSAAGYGKTVTTSRSVVVKAASGPVVLSAATVVGGSAIVVSGMVAIPIVSATDTVVALVSSDPSVSVPESVKIPAGALRAVFNVGTSLVGAAVKVKVGASIAGVAIGAAGITNEPAIATVTFDLAQIVGGTDSHPTVHLNAPFGNDVYVGLSSNHPDLLPLPDKVLISANTTSTLFTSTTLAGRPPAKITVHATFGDVTTTAALSLTPIVANLKFAPATVGGGAAVVMSMTVNGVFIDDLVFTLKSNDPRAVDLPLSVTLPARSNTTALTFPTLNVWESTSVEVFASIGEVQAGSETLTVVPLLKSLAFLPSTVLGGSTTTMTVTLTAASDFDTSVKLSTDQPGLIGLPATVKIPAGSAAVTVPISTSIVGAPITLAVTGLVGAASSKGRLKLLPPTVALSFDPATVVGGKSTKMMIAFNGTFSSPLVVELSVSPSRILDLPPSVTIPAGQRRVQVSAGTRPVAAVTSVVVTPSVLGVSQNPQTLIVSPN